MMFGTLFFVLFGLPVMFTYTLPSLQKNDLLKNVLECEQNTNGI